MLGISGQPAPPLANPESGLDRLIYRLVAYVLPAAFLLLSLHALLHWNALDRAPAEDPVAFRTAPDLAAAWTPALALRQLEEAPVQLSASAQLATHPIWMRVDLPDPGRAPDWLEFPSRHATQLDCWRDGQLVGRANRGQTQGALQPARAGFALSLADGAGGASLICRAQFSGPARISVLARSSEDLHRAEERFSRESGWLDGGLVMLALFLFVTALINRNGGYVLFAVWMLLNLRMAALSSGADVQWLGQRVPEDWLHPMRMLTIALYYASTYALFRNFFREELGRVGHGLMLRLAAWSCAALLACSLLLPYARFLPVVWVCAALNIGVLLYYLGRILWLTRSRVAMWYAGSIAITLFAGLAEVIAAALSLRITEVVNSTTAALSSSLLASLAVAAQMKQDRDQRKAAQAQLLATYEAMPIGLFSADFSGRLIAANPALRQMLGLPADQTAQWAEHFAPESWPQLLEQLHRQPNAEMELSGPTGRRFLVRATLAQRVIEGLLQDVTEQSRATENLRFMALNDPLTRVLNRRGVEQALGELQRSLPTDRRMAMAYLDLDRFKLLNDLYGHAAGDEVLQQVCERIRGLLSGDMKLGRVGGDEFVVLLPGVSLELACLIGRGILTAIGSPPYQVGDRAFQVRGSMGLIEIDAGTAFKDAMASADRACREAKGHHSDGLVVFEHNAQHLEELEAEMQLVARLAAGGEVEGLFLEMQPIMSLKKPHEALNFEVLLRMRDASGQRVPTPRLITAGEHSGRMSMIDRWVLRQTLEWLQAHRGQLASTQFVCMNLSGASLNDERFIDDVFDMLEANLEVAPLLCLEITESVALHDLDNTRRFIHQVRHFGAKVALDDFGAGYTSFSYLKDLPGDLLKIDGSFIVNMNEHPANIAIVEAIVSLANNLGMKTIAEWAEDAATVETLAEIGVDYVQGFAIAKAQDPAELLRRPSSAAFVRDVETRELVDRLQRQGNLPDLFVGTRVEAAA